MMVDMALLKSTIVKKGTNVSEVAARMGIDKATLYRRIAAAGTFTIGEVEKITDILNLSNDEAISIFFTNTVA